MPQSGSRARPAFTLIELLVVISIIGILAALLLVAISAISGKGPELQTTNDLRQLDIALNNFKQKHGVFPPSHIVLANSAQAINKADPSGQSLAYLLAIWPRLDFSGTSGPIDWSGTRELNRTYVLEGDQCLVFFLGGIPDVNNPSRHGCLGFSSNPLNPTDRSDLNKGTRESFYQFDSSRLFIRSRVAPVPFYSFADPWGTGKPYVYFSSNKRKDGYNPSPGDCPSLVLNGAYYDAASVNPKNYFNGTTFQIISAGKNGLFGPGGPWSASNATLIGDAGEDDQSNFSAANLGVPQ